MVAAFMDEKRVNGDRIKADWPIPMSVVVHRTYRRTGLLAVPVFHSQMPTLLTKLVLEEGGGPVTCRGRSAVIKKPTENPLLREGLIEIHGSSDFTQRMYLELNIDTAIREALDSRLSGVKITPVSVTEKLRYVAVATQAAFDLVTKCLPS